MKEVLEAILDDNGASENEKRLAKKLLDKIDKDSSYKEVFKVKDYGDLSGLPFYAGLFGCLLVKDRSSGNLSLIGDKKCVKIIKNVYDMEFQIGSSSVGDILTECYSKLEKDVSPTKNDLPYEVKRIRKRKASKTLDIESVKNLADRMWDSIG